MAHYHFQNQQAAYCDTLTVNCSIEPRYSSSDTALRYRGRQQPLGSEFKQVGQPIRSSSWFERNGSLLDLVLLPITLVAALFSSD